MSSDSSALFSRVVWPLAVAQTMFWASCFYVFHALLPRWEAHFGWSRADVSTAITIALLCSALSAPVMGTLIDRGYGRRVFLAGGVCASIILTLLSLIDSLWQFYTLWFVMGFCHAAILYEPCFAILTRLFRHDAKRAITRVTLFAGFAGTIAFPVGHYLSDWIGWEQALRVFSGIALVATLIAFITLKDTRYIQTDESDQLDVSRQSGVSEAIRNPVFWLIAASFSLMALNHGAILPHLLPLLNERQYDPGTAVLAASMIGPMQVFGRICMMAAEKRLSMVMIAVCSFLAVTLASIALLLSGSYPWLLVVFVILQGGGYGVTSITRPAVTVEFLGRREFGAISGIISIPFIGAFAIGPTLAALIWVSGGYTTVLGFTALCAAVGTLTFLLARRLVD